MKKIIPLLFITLCLSSCGIYYGANDGSVDLLLTETKEIITTLGEKVTTSGDDELIKAYATLKKESDSLMPVLKRCNENYRLTETYIETLEESKSVLEKLVTAFDTLSDKTYVINAIYQDYNAKLNSINSSKKSDANTKIKVIVDSSEDEGFFVFAKLSYEKDADIKRFRFNRPTDNASQNFVPGYYLFWLEKDDLIGEPELHLISINGSEKEIKIVLKTPKSNEK